MKTLFVMILFFNNARGGVATTIGGFHSLDACNRAIPKMVDAYSETGLKVTWGIMMSRDELKKELLKGVAGSCMALEAE